MVLFLKLKIKVCTQIARINNFQSSLVLGFLIAFIQGVVVKIKVVKEQ
jgi:hypothetical protein